MPGERDETGDVVRLRQTLAVSVSWLSSRPTLNVQLFQWIVSLTSMFCECELGVDRRERAASLLADVRDEERRSRRAAALSRAGAGRADAAGIADQPQPFEVWKRSSESLYC